MPKYIRNYLVTTRDLIQTIEVDGERLERTDSEEDGEVIEGFARWWTEDGRTPLDAVDPQLEAELEARYQARYGLE